jgi:hypothetical protein
MSENCKAACLEIFNLDSSAGFGGRPARQFARNVLGPIEVGRRVTPRVRWVPRGSARPSGDSREGGEPLPAGGECPGPGPGRVDMRPSASGVVGEAGGQGQQPHPSVEVTREVCGGHPAAVHFRGWA